LAYYFSADYAKARENAQKIITNYPDQVYGYEWSFNSAMVIDSTKQDSIAAPDALRLYEFAAKDTAKYRKQYLASVRFLAPYYINKAKDKDKALEFFGKWLEADTANADAIKGYMEQIRKAPTRPANGATRSTNGGAPKPAPPSVKNAKTKTTTVSVVSKK